MSDPMATFVDETNAFQARHRDELDELGPAATSFGMVTWGMMRALAECPDGPGTFRIPVGHRIGRSDGWDALACPTCQKVWTRQPDVPEVKKPSRKRRTA